ncbi:hypothetical protein GBF38_005522 [Nibea albiflora]|uniref:Uncharacterized protein n=1 Tax=Nibea albiflora TaxID=240163 RepID=A0ACB7EX68_NIBAL|nr:hypothetical protein GBF38_005522 [Nibea albiflora]
MDSIFLPRQQRKPKCRNRATASPFASALRLKAAPQRISQHRFRWTGDWRGDFKLLGPFPFRGHTTLVFVVVETRVGVAEWTASFFLASSASLNVETGPPSSPFASALRLKSGTAAHLQHRFRVRRGGDDVAGPGAGALGLPMIPRGNFTGFKAL